MPIKMILATGWNGELGKDNKLLMHIPEDLKHFKKVTEGKVVVMGRKTAESLPKGKPLPNRVNIVMTRQSGEELDEGFIICNDYERVLEFSKERDIFVIGGAEIYRLFEDYVDEIYHTEIYKCFDEADTYYHIGSYLRDKTIEVGIEYLGEFPCKVASVDLFKYTIVSRK